MHSSKNDADSVDAGLEKKEPLTLVFWFQLILGFMGWYLVVTLFWERFCTISNAMGPGAVILVPFYFAPCLGTIFAIGLGFIIQLIRKKAVNMRRQGIVIGIISAYVFNIIANIKPTDPEFLIQILESIVTIPFYFYMLFDC